MSEAINHAKLAVLFRKEFQLCNVQSGETIVLLSPSASITCRRKRTKNYGPTTRLKDDGRRARPSRSRALRQQARCLCEFCAWLQLRVEKALPRYYLRPRRAGVSTVQSLFDVESGQFYLDQRRDHRCRNRRLPLKLLRPLTG